MKNKSIFLSTGLLSFLVLLGMASCKKSDTGAPPTISQVRTISKTDTLNVTVPGRLDANGGVIDTTYSTPRVVPFDSTIVAGNLNNQYAIIGTHLGTALTVTFNGFAVFFNPGLVTDKSIIVTIDPNTPFGPSQNNQLVVTTKYGKASFTFPIQQPPPIITGFSPAVGSAGDTITIQGRVFQGLTGVRFGTVPATIVSFDSAQIKVIVPAGIVQAFIFVTTPGGTTEATNSFGFKSIVYLNGLSSGWGNYTGYSSTLNFANTSHLITGATNIAVTFASNYGALQIGYGGPTLSVSTLGLTAVKFSIEGGASIPDGQAAQVVINGNYGSSFQITVPAGGVATYTVPLSALGNPTSITEFVIQIENAPVPSTVYVDAIGFI